MPGLAQTPVGLQTQKLWERTRITPRYHRALGVISVKWADVSGASKNGHQDMFATRTRPGKSQAYM